jgi:membrane protease YdiL (CAAX protease family)
MFFKAIFKNSSAFTQFLLLIGVIGFCYLVTNVLLMFPVLFKYGMSFETIQDIQQNILNEPNLIRTMAFFQEIGIFIFPAIICAWLFSDNYKDYLRIDHPINRSAIIWTVISIIVLIPFLNLIYHFNQQMVFPEALKGVEEWMKWKEDTAAQVLEKMLYADNFGLLLFNIAVVCVLTGIGEELMFRGVLQNLLGKLVRNPHTVIWIVAILFSAIHFQFYGFINRMLLGAWLGYLLYYTKTIWIPILAHFTNNLIGVLIYYVYQDAPQKMQETETVGTGSTWWLSIASLALFVFCFGQIRRTKS